MHVLHFRDRQNGKIRHCAVFCHFDAFFRGNETINPNTVDFAESLRQMPASLTQMPKTI
jgi:hypothetical protein